MDVKAPYDPEEFIDFIQDFLPKEGFKEEGEEKQGKYSHEKTIFTRIRRIGEHKGLRLAVYEFWHKKGDPRVTLTRDAFKFLGNYEKQYNALAVFVKEKDVGQSEEDKNENYRFSLITSHLEKNLKTGDPKVIWSNPRRFSFVLGGGIPHNTPAKRLEGRVKDLNDLKERFSVSVLTKEFYKEIEDWFLRAAKGDPKNRIKRKVEFPGATYLKASNKEEGKEHHSASKEEEEEHQAKMTLRLITRLIFIWFLKEKGLVPEKLFNKDEIYPLLNRKKPSPYYRAILQNLFFATLNTPIEKRKWLEDCPKYCGINKNRGKQEYFRYRDFFKGEDERKKFFISEDERKKSLKDKKEQDDDYCGKIPFVNGGLFENLDGVKADGASQRDNEKRVDCFSDEPSNRFRLKVPDELFFGENDKGEWEKKEKKGKKKKEEKGIIDILSRYNFTVEENTPNDEDIALDPELLGCVFENLLAYVNPETSKPARNASGSFYTPRVIVDHMVSESLKAYLSTKVGDSGCLESLFKPVFDADEIKGADEFKNAVAKALGEIKILDPACGSGAFPMGMLSKMIEILEKIGKIDPSNPHQIYKKKLQIIQDCIYGVDIQDIAVQISKLRFFISLLCEQEVKPKEEDENRGIKPLPNLETKIVCANTLLSVPKSKYFDLSVGDEGIKETEENLRNARRDYFRADSKECKNKLRRIDKVLRKKLEKRITKFVTNNTEGRIKDKERELAQCKETLEKVKKPKYEYIATTEQLELGIEGSAEKKPKQQQLRIDVNKQKRQQLKKEVSDLEKEIENLKNDPSLEGAKFLANWDPYDPSICAEYFSPEWMFGLISDRKHTHKHSDGGDYKNGRVSESVFDIVIGNPPYISTKGNKKQKSTYIEEFGFSDDTYYLFTAKGLSLCKENGILSFITPKTFWTTQTKRNMRKRLLEKTVNYIFDTANPFEAAVVDTCVFQVRNAPCGEDHKINFLDGTESLISPKPLKPVEQSIYFNALNQVIFKPTELNLKVYKKYNEDVKALYNEWWEKIDESTKVSENRIELEAHRAELRLKPGALALMGCLIDGGQGLATADNGRFIALRDWSNKAEIAKRERPKKLAKAIENYEINLPKDLPGLTKSSSLKEIKEYLSSFSEQGIADLFDKLKEKHGRDIFDQGFLFKIIDDDKIADPDSLTEDEKENGIDPAKKNYYVIYDKGDRDGNKWFLETPYAIAWNKENVKFLKHPNIKGKGKPVVRNPQFYFKEGICWNVTSGDDLLCRKKKKGVYDVNSMFAMSATEWLPDEFFLCVLNSRLIGNYLRAFVNNTVAVQINDVRQIPIVIPTDEQLAKAKKLAERGIYLKKHNGSDKELESLQAEVDDFVANLYNLA